MDIVWIEKDRCTLCGLCIPICVRRILEEREGAVMVTDPTQCILCGHCKAICPEDAPQFPSLSAEEFSPFPRQEDLPQLEQLMALFRSRRSIRIFQRKAVEKDKLERIIQAGRFAPTGGNRQALHYVMLHSAERIQTIRTMAIDALVDQAGKIENAIKRARETDEPLAVRYQVRQSYPPIWREMGDLNKQGIDRLFYHAPALIICHFNPLESVTPEMDPGLSAMQMLLMAEALELGTCLCAFFVFALEESPELRKALQIPEDHRVPLSFMVGYSDVTFRRLVSRKPARVRWF
ncbi:MAG: nitroreductase family protein [Desulfobacteraceae bacterium]|nr:nitroreductase family protein [Desulfobacteraceae bacterium]